MGKGGQYQRLLLSIVILLGEVGAFLLLGALALGVIPTARTRGANAPHRESPAASSPPHTPHHRRPPQAPQRKGPEHRAAP
jgi:hypothetical protein